MAGALVVRMYAAAFCGCLCISPLVVQACFGPRHNRERERDREVEVSHTAKNSKISVRGPWMVDGHGRVRIFHGFNAVRKEPPWYPDTMTDRNLAFYRKWGFNAVRLGAMWAGVEPSEGATNSTYLDVIKDMVQRAGRSGIYILLDMHQDVISSAFHAYDGVPRWVIDKMPPAHHRYPWPLPEVLQWAGGYLTEAVGNAFQCLYDNVAGTRDAMGHFWQTVASTFRGYDNVIGYELINEPWAGDIYQYPDLLLPGNAGRKNLARLYEALNKAIRKVDNVTIIFYEPVTWGMVFAGHGILGSGFDTVPGGPAYANRSVMSWHYYCWVLAIDDHEPYSVLQKTVCDKFLGPKVYETIQLDIQRIGGGSFLTEFGLCEPNNHLNQTQTLECDFVMKLADTNLQSWTYWDSEFFNATTGEVRHGVIRHFARVYASATAGIPKAMVFDVQTRRFKFTFTSDSSISAPTEIIIPPLHYPNGFTVKVSPALTWKYDKQSHTMFVSPIRSNQAMSEETVSIFPK